jgi:Tol biopolymer transport system component
VFTRNESVALNLYAINPDGTGLVRITDFQPVFDTKMDHAVWSPAGDRIAVCGAYYPGTVGNRLWVLDVDLSQPNPGTGEGGRVTRVQPIERPDNAWDITPSWSPDGRRLVFKHGQSGQPSQILILDLETGGRSIVASAGVNGPDWDPTDLLP